MLVARSLSVGPLLLPGIGLILVGALSGAWASVAAIGAGVRRVNVPRRVTEGQAFAVALELRGRYLSAASVTVADPLSTAELAIGRGRWRARPGLARAPRVELVAAAGRRGLQILSAPRLRIADPLGLAQVIVTDTGAPDEVLVLPRIEPVQWATAGRARVGGEDGRSREPTGAGELDGLRDYRPVTPATRIHWPALARGAGLLERRLVAATSNLPLVVLDSRCADAPEDVELLDCAVRAAASLARELARAGGCGLLLPGSRLPLLAGPDLRAWPTLHTRLALVGPEPDQCRGPALRPDQLGGGLLYVASTRAVDLTAVRRHAPRVVLVAPDGPRGPTVGALFSVAGCSGYSVGPHAVRRAA